MSRCATRWLPGNYREQQAVIALDEAILEEFSKGLDDDFPPRLAYLLEDYTLEEVLRSTIVRKKFWLQSVEAAWTYSQPVYEDGSIAPYADMRSNLHKWMAGQTFYWVPVGTRDIVLTYRVRKTNRNLVLLIPASTSH